MQKKKEFIDDIFNYFFTEVTLGIFLHFRMQN
jgi:hypothetical protein